MNMADVIKVYVGTDSHMRKAELALEYSIRKTTKSPVDIIWMDTSRGGIWSGWDIGREPGRPYSTEGWATDFSCFRFAIPAANNYTGRAIYLDVDMILLKDINDLFTTPMDHPVLIPPRGFDVILYDCAAFKDKPWWPTLDEMKTSGWNIPDYSSLLMENHMIGTMSEIWDCLDGKGYEPAKTALIHYTDMNMQPWKPYPEVFAYPPHPRPDIVDLWWKTYEEALEASKKNKTEKT